VLLISNASLVFFWYVIVAWQMTN